MLIDDEVPPVHCMTYAERETVKQFSRRGENLTETLIMIAHWMSSTYDVSFSAYAANWAVAQRELGTAAIQRQWPLESARMIADGSTEWGSYLHKT